MPFTGTESKRSGEKPSSGTGSKGRSKMRSI